MYPKNTRRGFTQQTKKVVICPPCGESAAQVAKEGQNKENALWPLLPRLMAVLPPQGREITSHAFTLIELLVVVLIIGLLAAVALPQYNKTAKKAQGREVLLAAQAADKALAAYYLNHGNYEGSGTNKTITADDLEVNLPALKYFNYATNTSSTPSLSSAFQRTELYGDGQGEYPAVVFYDKHKEIGVALAHRNGKKWQLQCYGKNAPTTRCDSYFNCQWTTYSVAMCPREDCPVVTYTDCYLN